MDKWNLLHHTFVLLIIEQLIAFGAYASEDCQQKSECVCEYADGTSINLSKLLKPDKNGTVYLYDNKDNFTIYYHGCGDAPFRPNILNISEEFCRKPAAICVFDWETRALYAVAYASSGVFTKSDKMPNVHTLRYSHNGTTTSVTLVCTPEFLEDTIVLQNVTQDKKHYQLELFSQHACRSSLPHGLSTGSKLLIMFFSFALIYFIGGVCLSYFIRGARGRELIPNVDFWMSLPGLVKDGVVFILSGCNARLITTSDTYDQI